jgi:hypothetical protein
MGLFDNAIKQGLNKALGNAVANTLEKKVTETITPKVNEAANQAADAMKQAGTQTPQPQNTQAAGVQIGGMFAGLAGAAQSFANEAAKNMKICLACGEPANADVKFCPKCGAELPAQTAAQGAVCSSCGKQNDIGTKFCADCGAKLPSAIAEEQAMQTKSEAVLVQWDTLLPQYPKWCCGGYDLGLEQVAESDGGYPYYSFSVCGVGQNEVGQYRQLLKQNGFRPAGRYPDEGQLFKRVSGLVYNCDIEHAFDVSEYISLGFTVREPNGGFDYVKPEPTQKKSTGFGGLGGLFGKR